MGSGLLASHHEPRRGSCADMEHSKEDWDFGDSELLRPGVEHPVSSVRRVRLVMHLQLFVPLLLGPLLRDLHVRSALHLHHGTEGQRTREHSVPDLGAGAGSFDHPGRDRNLGVDGDDRCVGLAAVAQVVVVGCAPLGVEELHGGHALGAGRDLSVLVLRCRSERLLVVSLLMARVGHVGRVFHHLRHGSSSDVLRVACEAIRIPFRGKCADRRDRPHYRCF